MIFDALNTAATSLRANQKVIDVISHNIANVNTAGYSRQVADLGTVMPDRVGNLNFGRGIEIKNIHRTIDPIINQAQLNNSSQLAYWQKMSTGLNSVENIFGSLQSTGLASSLDEFFLSWQQLANNPQDLAQKTNVRAKSNSIITNLNNMQQQLLEAQQSTDASIDQAITTVNQILDHIGSLNQQINRQEITGLNGVGAANDLRDQRDIAFRQLAAIIPIQRVGASDGSFLIQTLDGDMLVQDTTARHLARGSAIPGSFADVVIEGTGQPVTGAGRGGEIGAFIELRDNKFGGYRDDLNSIAANLIFSVNQIHASASSATQLKQISAEQASNAALALDDIAQTASFANQVQTGSFKVHVYDATGIATPAGGTNIAISAGTTSMNDIVTSLNAVAGITASVDGSGRLSINAAIGNSFALSDDSSNMLAAYEINTFFKGNNAATISLSASVQASATAIHTGQINAATSAISSGDNQAAMAMVALQDAAISIDGTPALSLHNRTGTLSTSYGADASVATQQLQYRTVEADSLESQRQAISGVSIDEELIDMIKFQRAYEASAKVITTTNQMLDSLMGLIR